MDIAARRRGANPIFEPHDFYGQLRTILEIDIPRSQQLGTANPEKLLLAVVHALKTEIVRGAGGAVQYKETTAGLGRLDVVDLATLQCGIGRVSDRGHWVLIDRSGPYAQASFSLAT